MSAMSRRTTGAVRSLSGEVVVVGVGVNGAVTMAALPRGIYTRNVAENRPPGQGGSPLPPHTAAGARKLAAALIAAAARAEGEEPGQGAAS